MRAYKSIISFCLLLVAIRRGSSAYTPLDEKAKCVNSKLIQYANYYVCVCEDGKVHESDLSCLEPIKSKCTKADDLCGDYAKCAAKGSPPDQTFECECLNGYELNSATPPVCVPKGCKAIGDTCGTGVCSKKDDSNPICACHLGSKLDAVSGKCVDDPSGAVECKLSCTGDNMQCNVDKSGFFACGCSDGFEMKEGKCVAKPVDDKYVPLDEKAKCENSTLVQYANYYACACETGKVHSNDLTCVEQITGECTKADEICGEYASCVAEGPVRNAKFVCKCMKGYELNAAEPPVCVPEGCNDLTDTCKGSSCIKKDDTTAQCGCLLENKLDPASGKCIADTETPKCNLNCTGDNVACIFDKSGFFYCDCTDGFEMKEGKCVAKPVDDKYVPLNENAKCENSTLVQYANYFACVCESGKVHASDLKCVEQISGECTKADEICGEYASCVTEGVAPNLKHECKCMKGYEYNDAVPPVCVPVGCHALANKCKDSSCIKKDSTTAQCGCFLSTKFDESLGECVADSDEPVCKLTCVGENTGCVIENTTNFKCDCKDKYELKDGKCVEKSNSKGGAFPASGILNVGLLFIASSIIYVLV